MFSSLQGGFFLSIYQFEVLITTLFLIKPDALQESHNEVGIQHLAEHVSSWNLSFLSLMGHPTAAAFPKRP